MRRRTASRISLSTCFSRVTKHRTAEDIARQVDSLGGNMDAFTAKECICFTAKVLDEHLPAAMDVLSDLVLNPLFEAKDINRERGVILEEIKMDEDNPRLSGTRDLHAEFLEKTIRSASRSWERKKPSSALNSPWFPSFTGQRFYPGNMIIAAAGNLKHKQFLDMIREHFEGMKTGSNGHVGTAPKIVPPHYHAQQEGPGAGATVCGCAGVSHCP